MNQFTIKIVISLLTGGFCLLTWKLFIENPHRVEWFSISMLFLYFIGIAVLYLILLTTIGFVLRYLKKLVASKAVFQTTLYSTIILLALMIYTRISLNQDFKVWREQDEETSLENKKLKEEQQKATIDSLNKVINIEPKNYNAFVQKGLIKRKQGDYLESIVEYEKALEINPNDFKANVEMGYSLELLNNIEQRDSFYRIAVNLDPNSYFAKTHPEYLK